MTLGRLIQILPPELANKIAAGEVVQRPASAVKELIENSLDAGATSITVVLKDSGKALIQVIDNGVGMEAEDAILAFERHATSKIATYEDLERIGTFGFRGEALASIASISHAELSTRTKEDAVGTQVKVEGGIVVEITEAAVPVGTSISVKNLFFNTPGRRNFLKGNPTEFKHVADVIQRAAISHPTVDFSFISDDEAIIDVRSSGSDERLCAILGEKFFENVFPFQQENEVFRLQGYLGRASAARKSRAEQYIFLNDRYIVSRSLNHAVFQAYEHLLEKGSWPVFILFLHADPQQVDVNVHPSKMEVKFEDEQSVYRFILSSVRAALSANDLIPSVTMGSPARFASGNLQFTENAEGGKNIDWRQLISGPISAPGQLQAETPAQNEEDAPAGPTLQPIAPDVPVFQLHNKYIIVPTNEGMMLVDQHAAHERVIYERSLGRIQNHDAKSQQLLFPQTIEMSAADASLVRQLSEYLELIGFSLKFFGKTTVIVDGVPADVKPGAEARILSDVLDSYKEDEHRVRMESRERLAKVFSCKAAVKAGDPLQLTEIRALLNQLFATEIPFVCPHGRPVIVKLSLPELDRRFGRTS